MDKKEKSLTKSRLESRTVGGKKYCTVFERVKIGRKCYRTGKDIPVHSESQEKTLRDYAEIVNG